MRDMQNELEMLKRQISHQENLNVSTNLRLCGIPFHQNENLSTIFQHLCASINITPPNIKSIQRIKQRNTTVDGVILVKLFTAHERNNILRATNNFKRHNKTHLYLRIVGFDSDAPFFVNEDLTSANYKLLQAALRLKRKKMVSAVFTLRGVLHVKCNDADTALRIESIDRLNSLFRSSQLSPNTLPPSNYALN